MNVTTSRFIRFVTYQKIRKGMVTAQLLQRASISFRTLVKGKESAKAEAPPEWPRKIFSGIQPTGSLHLGNYLGAVQKWKEMQDDGEDVTYCIVDMHSLTLPPDPFTLRENIFQMAAALLACGIDPNKSTLFVQSAVKEHAELSWILGCGCTMARLGHLPQYKEKTRIMKDIPLGLFVYPVLQAADIMLHKATHVPVGEDQIQHIQLAQHLSKTFNTKYGDIFPICHAIVEKNGSRIRSLRDPTKKMSKSDKDLRSTIFVTDEPDVIVEKIKKAVTDFQSDVSFNLDQRPGVSNLITIHAMLSNKKIEDIITEAKTIDTGKYKMRVAEIVVEYLRPIRSKIIHQLIRRNELIQILEIGAEKARQTASTTIIDVKQKLGIGAFLTMPAMQETKEETKVETSKLILEKEETKERDGMEMPIVPKQQLRVEKARQMRIAITTENRVEIPKPEFQKIPFDGRSDLKSTKPAKQEEVPVKALVPKVDSITTELIAEKKQKEGKI